MKILASPCHTPGLHRYLFLALSLGALTTSPFTQAEGENTAAPPAAAASSQVQQRPMIRSKVSPDLSRVQDLAKSNSPETEVIWLETDSDRTLGLFHEQGQNTPLGAVLIFPDQGTHADWPDYARPLRLNLTEQGWHTFSVQLPTPPTLTPPERTLPVLQLLGAKPAAGTEGEAAADQAPAEGSAETAAPSPPKQTVEIQDPPPAPLPPYQQRIQQLSVAALNVLQQRGAQQIVVIGVGSGAVWAADLMQSLQTQVPAGLVMINPRQPEVTDAPELKDLMQQLQVPVVDIYQSLPASTSGFEAEPKQRLRWARRSQLQHYLQRRLSTRYQDWEKQERWLSQQVDGMIRRHILTPIEVLQKAKENAEEENLSEQAPGQQIKPAGSI